MSGIATSIRPSLTAWGIALAFSLLPPGAGSLAQAEDEAEDAPSEEKGLVAIPEAERRASEAEPEKSRADLTLDELVDELDQANLQEAFRILRSDYIKSDSLSYLELNRAAMQGLLERLDFGAMLLTRASREARDSPFDFHSEKLSDAIGYVRFGQFDKEELESLDKALVRFLDEPEMATLIVDLRSPQAMASFEIAASILGRFRPAGEVVFKITRPGQDRPRLFTTRPAPKPWDRNLIVLIDRETGNVGEIIAAVLNQESGALVIGEPTIGMTVEYQDIPVGDDRLLRYAVAEVVLPEGESLFQKGVQPDVLTPSSPKVKQAIFREVEKRPLADFVFDRVRPRMNEAALVAGTDPELDYYVAKSNGRQTSWDKPLFRDRVLRQAVDLVTVTGFLPVEGLGGEPEPDLVAEPPKEEGDSDTETPDKDGDPEGSEEPEDKTPAKAKDEPEPSADGDESDEGDEGDEEPEFEEREDGEGKNAAEDGA